jgi:CRP-like cAMP-binding protein/small-conductance mechanosensitive channel
MTTVHPHIKRLNVLIVFLLMANIALGLGLQLRSGSPWGWVYFSIDENETWTFDHGFAILQFILFSVTTDCFIQRSCTLFNLHSQNTQLPRILVQFIRIMVYGLFALAGFILLYDHSIKTLIAASGAIGVGIAYSLKDFLTDYFASIEIQFDNRVAIGDWIEISDEGTTQIYKILDMDHRMVSVLNYDNQVTLIPNTKFISAQFANLNRQRQGCRRQIEIQIDAKYSSDRILPLLRLAVDHASKSHADIEDYANCLIGGVVDGNIIYLVKYQCSPHLPISDSNSLIFESVLRFLWSASISLEAFMCIEEPQEYEDDKIRRLFDLQMFGILKVLTPEELMVLGQKCSIREYQVGQNVVTMGDAGETMFLISEGTLEVCVPNSAGEMKPVTTLWPGDCLGEMSLLTGAPRSANVNAMTDVVLIEIMKEDLDPLLRDNPKLVDSLSRILADRSRHNALHSSSNDQDAADRARRNNLATQIATFFGFVRKII